MKKDKKVIAAELAVKAKREEIEQTQERVKLLESELKGLIQSVRHAQAEIDKLLPSCKLVTKDWYGGNVKSVEKVAILRRTKTGRLVVKRIGDTSEGCEYVFKYCEYSGCFKPLERPHRFSDIRALAGVPDEFMPKRDAI